MSYAELNNLNSATVVSHTIGGLQWHECVCTAVSLHLSHSYYNSGLFLFKVPRKTRSRVGRSFNRQTRCASAQVLKLEKSSVASEPRASISLFHSIRLLSHNQNN